LAPVGLIMKKLLVIVVLGLFLITPSQADDIRDFQIEGMSIGDSLLDYFSEEEINNFDKVLYPNKKFYGLDTSSSSYKIFEQVQFSLKNNDYKIYGISGGILYSNNIKKCLEKKKSVLAELKNVFKNSETRSYKRKHDADKSGKSEQHTTEISLGNKNGLVVVECYDWSEKMRVENNWHDNLSVSIYSLEFENFLRNEAF